MTNSTIFTVGGTVQAGGGIYIKRKADDELLDLCRKSEFAFILSSRQVGKSSLMVRTAQQLEKENIHSVMIDLSAIGVNLTQDEWYLGILNEISSSLNLQSDIFSWWAKYSQLGPAQRLVNFFKDVLLKEVAEPVILFFDEIDSTLSIPFSDDFYVALRAVYNARSTTPDFRRLSFVLVGVAAPGDLISDSKRTPFNIGRRVEINDFTPIEALPLAEAFGQQAPQVLTWVFQYTSGHPYLTQRLCSYLAGLKVALDEETVAKMVEHLFTGEEGKQDNNLQFVRDMLSKRSPDVTRVLSIYKKIRSGKLVMDDERSITKAHLKLSGLVRSEQGILRVRNEIYNTVFNLRWIQDNTPKNWQKTALISLSVSLLVILLSTLGLFINDFMVGSRVDKCFRDFISATTPVQRLSNLACIYKQRGILSNTDSNFTASQLFYGLSSAEDQLALFTDPAINNSTDLQNDLVTVISELYSTVANVNPRADNTKLLETMRDALGNVPDDRTAVDLQKEIKAWIEGRTKTSTGDLDGALTSYSEALTLNPANHAVLYERAKVFIAKGQYENALQDLDSSIGYAKQAIPDIEASPTPAESPTVAVTSTSSPTQPVTETLSLTATPSGNGLPPIIINTPVSGTVPASTPPPASGPITPPLRKFESNFATLIDVINAVKDLIQSDPQLQATLQAGAVSYTNLQSFGLVVVETETLPAAQSQNLITPVVDGSRAWGVDVSSFESTASAIDWTQVKTMGASFAFIKATDGLNKNSKFEENWAGTKAAGIPRSAYHFFHLDIDPAQQANNFIQIVQATGDSGELPLVLDLENITGAQISNAKLIANVKIWLDVVEQGLGRKPIIYSGQFFLQDYLVEAGGSPPSWAKDYPLWIAQYPRQYADDLQPPLPRGWSTWTFWQYSERGSVDGITSQVDLNLFNGSPSDLQQFINSSSGNGQPPLPASTPAFTPASNSIGAGQDTPMILIPAGDFIMGSENGEADERPIHKVFLSAYSIDQTEVTNTMYSRCVVEKRCNLPSNTSHYSDVTYANHPVVFVSWNDAFAYCSWAGRRLPTEAEWEKAARGTDGRTYPWGENIDCSFANYDLSSGSCVGDTISVGSYKIGQSPFGVYDMAGNVWEWVNDLYHGTYYQTSPSSNPLGPETGLGRVLRGGSWVDLSYNLRSSVRNWGGASDSSSDIGFRCASSVP